MFMDVHGKIINTMLDVVTNVGWAFEYESPPSPPLFFDWLYRHI
jgi:hypothetical protein